MADVIRDLGWNAIHVGDVGLGGRDDTDVMAHAWRENRILLTHDSDFLDDGAFPPHRNPGVVVLPGAEGGTTSLDRELARVLNTIGLHADAYRGFKIQIRENGTWSVRSPGTPKHKARELRFLPSGEVQELVHDHRDSEDK